MIAGAADGGGAVVLRGEAGIGKSALLVEAMEGASARGMTVFTATGVQSEAQLPFAGLHQLLRAVLTDRNELPTSQVIDVRIQRGQDPRRPGGSTPMGKVRLSITMSLDGFVAGPNQSAEHPFGIGGMQLHRWLLPRKSLPREARGGRRRDQHRARRSPRKSLAMWARPSWVETCSAAGPDRGAPILRRAFCGANLRTDTRSSCSPAIRAGLEMEGGTRFYSEQAAHKHRVDEERGD